MGNQMLAQNMGSEVTLYPCKTFDPTTGNDEWHFSTSPCNNELQEVDVIGHYNPKNPIPTGCYTVCPYCNNYMTCMDYDRHMCAGKYASQGTSTPPPTTVIPSPPSGGGTIGGNAGGSTGTSKGNASSPQEHTLHIPAIDEKCIKYKDGKEYLPASYPKQDCDMNCYTTSMEYCYNLFRGRLDDTTKLIRDDFEMEYIKKYRPKYNLCTKGFEKDQFDFLTYCGFDVQNINLTDGKKAIQQAILDNHPIMATLKTDKGGAHEVVIISYHESNGLFEAIDPGPGNIHIIDYSKITEAYIINGYSFK